MVIWLPCQPWDLNPQPSRHELHSSFLTLTLLIDLCHYGMFILGKQKHVVLCAFFLFVSCIFLCFHLTINYILVRLYTFLKLRCTSHFFDCMWFSLVFVGGRVKTAYKHFGMCLYPFLTVVSGSVCSSAFSECTAMQCTGSDIMHSFLCNMQIVGRARWWKAQL